jgi:hypothetical protein
LDVQIGAKQPEVEVRVSAPITARRPFERSEPRNEFSALQRFETLLESLSEQQQSPKRKFDALPDCVLR